jgi:hypothetical protein
MKRLLNNSANSLHRPVESKSQSGHSDCEFVFAEFGRLQCIDIAIATQPVGFIRKLSTTITLVRPVDNTNAATEALAHRIEIATRDGTQALRMETMT